MASNPYKINNGSSAYSMQYRPAPNKKPKVYDTGRKTPAQYDARGMPTNLDKILNSKYGIGGQSATAQAGYGGPVHGSAAYNKYGARGGTTSSGGNNNSGGNTYSGGSSSSSTKPPTGHYTADQLAAMFGINIDSAGIRKYLEEATGAQFDKYDTEVKRHRDAALEANAGNYDRYLQNMRNQRADSLQSGATSGMNAANEISALLGAQQAGAQGQTEANRTLFDSAQDRTAQMKQDAIMAEQLSNERRQMLAGLGVNLRGQDLSHAQSMANIGIAQQRLGMDKTLMDRQVAQEDYMRNLMGEDAYALNQLGYNLSKDDLNMMSGGNINTPEYINRTFMDTLLGYDPNKQAKSGFFPGAQAFLAGNFGEWQANLARQNAIGNYNSQGPSQVTRDYEAYLKSLQNR